MISLLRSLVCPAFLTGILCGQSLHISPSTAAANTTGSFSIALDSPVGKAPVALQWDIAIPPALAVGTSDILIGRSGEMLHKSLTCAPRKKDGPQQGVSYSCILAGGKEPIGNGPIATVHYRAQADVHGAPIRVSIESVLGVSKDLKRIDMPHVDAILKIQ